MDPGRLDLEHGPFSFRDPQLPQWSASNINNFLSRAGAIGSPGRAAQVLDLYRIHTDTISIVEVATDARALPLSTGSITTTTIQPPQSRERDHGQRHDLDSVLLIFPPMRQTIWVRFRYQRGRLQQSGGLVRG